MTVLIEETKSTTGASTAVASPTGYFNVSITGTFSATVELQRKLPGQASFNKVKSWTAPAEETLFEVEDGTVYQFNVTARASGTIGYRMSQGLSKYLGYRG